MFSVTEGNQCKQPVSSYHSPGQGFLKVEAKVLYPQIYWQEHPVQVSADDLLQQIAQIFKAELEIFV